LLPAASTLSCARGPAQLPSAALPSRLLSPPSLPSAHLIRVLITEGVRTPIPIPIPNLLRPSRPPTPAPQAAPPLQLASSHSPCQGGGIARQSEAAALRQQSLSHKSIGNVRGRLPPAEEPTFSPDLLSRQLPSARQSGERVFDALYQKATEYRLHKELLRVERDAGVLQECTFRPDLRKGLSRWEQVEELHS